MIVDIPKPAGAELRYPGHQALEAIHRRFRAPLMTAARFAIFTDPPRLELP